MAGTKTRTQRRMEKKQALTLLILVLIVSLSSFTLGVIVGRRGAERDISLHADEPRRIMVAETPVSQPATETAAEPQEETVEEEEKLTFYDNLSRGETVPLGSGINLPPEEKKPVAEKVDAAPIPLTEKPAKVVPVPKPAAEQAQAPEPLGKIPEAVASGTFSVQVGSFSSVADAGRYKRSLVQKGYPAFIAEADLGAKGIWYRVRLGPYADAEMAKKAMAIAAKKDNIKGFVSRL
jgi:cell division protein FtsN